MSVISGYVIPKGAQVLMSQYVMHHDPRYFPDPERLIPNAGHRRAKAGHNSLIFLLVADRVGVSATLSR